MCWDLTKALLSEGKCLRECFIGAPGPWTRGARASSQAIGRSAAMTKVFQPVT